MERTCLRCAQAAVTYNNEKRFCVEHRKAYFAERSAAWRVRNPIRPKHKPRPSKQTRRHHLWSAYRLREEDYEAALERQGGVCAICQQPEPTFKHLAVDHDHESGAVRGLLCGPCNKGLGLFRDDMKLLESAVDYLMYKG